MRSELKLVFLLWIPIIASGCEARATFKESRTQHVPHVSGSALNVESANGNISVSKSDRSDVQIVADLKALTEERLSEMRVVAERDANDQLVVRVEWPDRRYGNEGCDFDIQIPDAVGVTLKSSNGRIDVVNLAGDADLTTSNGTVKVNGLAGNAKLKTSNGKIAVNEVSGSINVDTSNGTIEIGNAHADVIADTSNGKITMSLADDATGPFHLESSNGGVSVELNAAFSGLLSCRTSNGSIKLEGVTGSLVNDEKNKKTIQFGNASTMSEIKTSNSSVNIKQRSESLR